MLEVNEKLTRSVAELARLDLSDAEVAAFTQQLGSILGYVDQLQKVDVQGVEPLVHPFSLETALREDEVRPSPVDTNGNPKTLQSAPEVIDGGFKVPPIL